MIDKERRQFIAYLKKHGGIPTFDDFLFYWLQPDKLVTPETCYEYGLTIFQEFCHFLDNKYGKDKRIELLDEFWEKVK